MLTFLKRLLKKLPLNKKHIVENDDFEILRWIYEFSRKKKAKIPESYSFLFRVSFTFLKKSPKVISYIGQNIKKKRYKNCIHRQFQSKLLNESEPRDGECTE